MGGVSAHAIWWHMACGAGNVDAKVCMEPSIQATKLTLQEHMKTPSIVRSRMVKLRQDFMKYCQLCGIFRLCNISLAMKFPVHRPEIKPISVVHIGMSHWTYDMRAKSMSEQVYLIIPKFGRYIWRNASARSSNTSIQSTNFTPLYLMHK